MICGREECSNEAEWKKALHHSQTEWHRKFRCDGLIAFVVKSMSMQLYWHDTLGAMLTDVHFVDVR